MRIIIGFTLTCFYLLSGCSLVPNGLKPMSMRLQDPEYVKYLEEKQRRIDAETIKFIGLSNIKSIFLGTFGNQDSAELIREKVRLLFADNPRFQIVNDDSTADAILTGVAVSSQSQHSGSYVDIYGNVRPVGFSKTREQAVLRLIDAKSKNTIWNFEDSSKDVAHNLIKQLLEDTKKAEDLKTRTQNESGSVHKKMNSPTN